jgi:hypothetical protein
MVVVAAALAGCGGASDPTAEQPYGAMIRDWQAREALCPAIALPAIEEDRGLSLSLRQLASGLLALMSLQRERVPDDPGRVSEAWQTSSETLARGRGVCSDVAILALAGMRQAGLVERFGLDPRLRILDMGKGAVPHMIVVVFTDDPAETYEISNLTVSRGESERPVLAEFDETYIYQ